jgi:hypothetical protein
VAGRRRAEAERQQRQARPVRIVAIVLLALVVIGVIGAAFSDNGREREVLTVGDRTSGETTEIDLSISPVAGVGIAMLLVGVGIVVRLALISGGWSLFWATSPPRRGKPRPQLSAAVMRWGYRIGLALAALGLFATLVGSAID